MSEYYVLEAGVRGVDGVATLNLDLVKYTTNEAEVREVSIETEISDFHKLMMQDFSGWGATNDVYNAELRNKRKIHSYSQYGAPISSTEQLKITYITGMDMKAALGESGIAKIKELAGGSIRDIHITAFADSKVDAVEGRGKFDDFMYQLTQLERVLGGSVRYPKWFMDKLNSEKSDLEYARRRKEREAAEAAEAAKKPQGQTIEAAIEQVKETLKTPTTPPVDVKDENPTTNLIDRVTIIADILAGVMEAPHSITVKSDGEVDVKLVYKHPRFEELKDGLKTELKYKWRVTEKVWRGSLKDIGKAVRPDFTLKMLLDFIHRNPGIKGQLEDEVKILLEVLAKGGLKYQQPK